MSIKISQKFAISLVLAVILGGLIIALNVLNADSDDRDHGFIAKDCGPIQWAAWFYPVTILVDDSARDWAPEVSEAAQRWNEEVGYEVLRAESAPASAWDQFRAALSGEGVEPIQQVLLVSGGGHLDIVSSDSAHGYARLRWNPSTCRLGYGALALPDGEPLSANVRRRVALHESGHILGLDDDEKPSSVMFSEALDEGFEITAQDIQRVRLTTRL